MKKLIIILGCVLLGAYIFGLIVGDSPDSVKSKTTEVIQKQIDTYNPIP